MKILVTGGQGFIGKAFIKRYRHMFDIVAPTQAQMDLADARSIDAVFKKNKFDAVLHLFGALEISADKASENMVAFKNIQYMSIVHGVKKLIVIGEGVEFDSGRPIVDASESMLGKSVPTDGYALSRYMISNLAAKDKITTVLRVFDVYGHGGKGTIDKMIAAAAHGKNITLNQDRTVSAVYIEDLEKVIVAVLKGHIKRGDYNVVSGDKASYLDIAKSLKRRAKRDECAIDIKVKNPAPALEYTATNEKLLKALPTFKPLSIKDGVKKCYHDIKA
ncbi:MAG: sugar nucleotide-binding protein [Clostridiales bacterium]|nr:sugar nucleotide-binding protein [Clostridiales bacterium]